MKTRFLDSTRATTRRVTLFVWEATDNEDRIVFTGLALLGAGIAHFSRAAALITVGVLLILAVRPLRTWFYGSAGK